MKEKPANVQTESSVNSANGQTLTETKIWHFKTLAVIPLTITPVHLNRGWRRGAGRRGRKGSWEISALDSCDDVTQQHLSAVPSEKSFLNRAHRQQWVWVSSKLYFGKRYNLHVQKVISVSPLHLRFSEGSLLLVVMEIHTPCVTSPVLVDRRITSLDLLAMLCLMQPWTPFTAFAARSHCLLMSKLMSTASFSDKLRFSWVDSSIYRCLGLFLPRCRTLHFPLLNFMRLLSAHFSSLSRSLWMAAQPYGISATPPSFVPSANLLRVHCLII